MPNRTPTYDDLSALCAQMAAALETVKQQDVYGKLPFRAHVAIEKSLTAYRTLSPDPVYAEAANLRDKLELVLPMAKGYSAQNPYGGNLDYVKVAEEVLNRARGEG